MSKVGKMDALTFAELVACEMTEAQPKMPHGPHFDHVACRDVVAAWQVGRIYLDAIKFVLLSQSPEAKELVRKWKARDVA